MSIRPLSLAFAGLLLAGSAQALTVVADSNVISLQRTDWSSQLLLPRFDLPGTLTGVQIELFGTLTGRAGVESMDQQPVTVTATLSAALSLTRPDQSLLVVTIPTQSWTLDAPVYDGVRDFGGASGRTHVVAEPVEHSEVGSFSSAADLQLFSGTGLLALPVSALDLSITSASGNVADRYRSEAGAWARVTYTYAAAPVPEPQTWALMLAGLLMTGYMARRRGR